MDCGATTPVYSAAGFRSRLSVRPTPAAVPTEDGDHRFNPDLRGMILRPDLVPAAVLVPIVDREPDAAVLLTKRAERLRGHSGQIAFPGGRIDPTDSSPEQAALREAGEEIGLAHEDVEIVGRMNDYATGSGYRVAPVLGIVRPSYVLTLNTDEVDDTFEVPLSFLMDPANHRRDSRLWHERERFFYAMPYGERYIWGATAGIIRMLYERLYA